MGKIALHIEVDADLLARAREAGVTLEDAAEFGLRLAIANNDQGPAVGLVANHARQISDPAGASGRARQWADDNAQAVAIHNERIAARGVFGEDLRRW